MKRKVAVRENKSGSHLTEAEVGKVAAVALLLIKHHRLNLMSQFGMAGK